jgi:predicted dehydrogenase
MNKTVTWGILSTAHINRRVIPEIHASDRGALRAVASRNADQARAYADEWEIPVSYGSYEALLADAEIDVVYVPLPNHLHMEWVIRALESGKHVLCEKPMCLSADEFDRIREASNATGKCVMEAFMYRHHPQIQLFRSIIESGTIGDVKGMYSEFVAAFSRDADNYRMQAEIGGGALLDVGVYPISFFQYLDPSPVSRVDARAHIEGGIDLSVWATLEFASGVTAQFFASFVSEYSTRTSVMGTKGRLDITHPFNATHLCEAWTTISGEKQSIELPQIALYAGEIENMNDVVLGIGKPLFSLDDSLRVLETVLQIKQQILPQ